VKVRKRSAQLDREIAQALAKSAASAYFKIGDIVLISKYKNKRGMVVGFGQDTWGNPTVEVEPIPKGRKQNRIIGLYKIWRADVKESVLKKRSPERTKKKGKR